jgi:cystathionine gamma-synthase
MARKRGEQRPETVAAQALNYLDTVSGALTPPIQPSTTFARDEAYRLLSEHSYSRHGNPTFEPAEAVMTRLEGGADSLLFSSGMAASMAVVQALRPGDRIALPRIMYWGLRAWLIEFAEDWGLGLDFYDETEPKSLEAALRPGQTKILWVETPANPTWSIIDLQAAAKAAKAANARLVVDSTVATPLITRPLEWGADLVFHSATKYLNGHGDVVAGVLVTAREDDFWQRIRANRANGGAILGPFEAWLLLRGLRTLHVRVERACSNALALARHFEKHPKLLAVLYPGLPGFAGHELAKRQMTGGYGGMLSLRVKGGREAALRVVAALKVFHRATSLGGVESLIEHRASIEPADSPIPADLLRLSIGIEAVEDLIADLEQALAEA